MQRISIQLPGDLLEVLKRRARLRKISISYYALDLINQSLNKPSLDKSSHHISHPTKIDQYLLKSGIESLILMRRLIPEKDRAFITQATEMAREVMKQLLSKEGLDEKDAKS